ncbi:MAG TPA: hypothetical protein VFB16_13045 [Bauldia sp.]|nr:hypothetical protein [Bauldia sp.]
MRAETARSLRFGSVVVAAILWFAAFVALFRHDLGDPLVAAAVLALAGAVVFALGRIPAGG